MSDQVSQILSLPTKASYTAVEELMKMVLHNFLFVFIAFFALDYFVTLWDSSALFTSWRNNTQGENTRDALDYLFGFRKSSDGMLRWGVVALVFLYATYYSVRRWGTSAIALSGPVSVFVLAFLVKVLMNIGSKPGDADCEADDLSFGSATWCYIDRVNTYMFIGDEGDNDSNIYVLLGSFVGFMLATRYSFL